MIFPDLRGLPLHRVLVRTVKEFLDDEMSTYASALAYQMLFSLFPFLLFLIALIGFLHCRISSPGCACSRNWCRRRRWSRSTR
jgi:uncharacterized BrkB/YihY/UPF0761 family membrane protein